jgi:hypothetical protein
MMLIRTGKFIFILENRPGGDWRNGEKAGKWFES